MTPEYLAVVEHEHEQRACAADNIELLGRMLAQARRGLATGRPEEAAKALLSIQTVAGSAAARLEAACAFREGARAMLSKVTA